MDPVSLPAHFDGMHILLDEPYALKPNAKLLVTVLTEADADREAWLTLSILGLANCYDENEPEYPLSCVREMNSLYERG